MKELSKDFEFFKDDNPQLIRPFIAACRDYESEGYKWVLACLTEDEAREVFEDMKKYFN